MFKPSGQTMKTKSSRQSRKTKTVPRRGRRSPAEPTDAVTPSPERHTTRRRTADGERSSGAASAGGRREEARKRTVSAGEGMMNAWSLLAGEKDFHVLVEIAPDAIFIHQNGRYVSINPAGLRLYGARHADEIIGTPVLDLVHPDYREFVRDRIELSYHLKRVASLQDSRILRLDGTAVPVEATSAPVVVKGKPATLVILRDVSWRRQHEAALRESEQQLRAILNSPGVFLGILEDHGNDILFVAANAELAAAYQTKPEAFSGKFASELGMPREFIEEHLRHYDIARRNGAAETWEYHRVWGKRQLWALATVSYIGRGPEGRHRYTFLAQDITERKKAEELLQRSEAEFRGMFELSGVGMAEADPATGRFLRANRTFCEITGYAEHELLERSFRQITHPEDLSVDAARWERVVRGETDRWFSEKRYVRKDGAVVHVAVNGTCIRDPEGRPYRTIAVIQDITDRRRAETAQQHRHPDEER
jgi:PAS domain S-box-containing protein